MVPGLKECWYQPKDDRLCASVFASAHATECDNMGKQSRRTRTQQHFHHRVIGVIDPDDEFGFVYTVGLHPRASELVALEVPRADMEDVARLMNFLSDRVVMDKQTAQSQKGRIYIIRSPPDGLEQYLKSTTCTQVDPHAGIFVLAPREWFAESGMCLVSWLA